VVFTSFSLRRKERAKRLEKKSLKIKSITHEKHNYINRIFSDVG